MGVEGSNQFGRLVSKTLYKWGYRCRISDSAMVKLGHITCLFGLSLLVGCVQTTITNLTPKGMTRNSAGFYPIEMIWESNQAALRRETVKPVVLVGTNAYPMKRTQLLTNRWETLVPIGLKAKALRYRIKVNWQFNAIPVPQADSQLSKEFLLRVED